MTPDVNVMVAASRVDHSHHDKALSWLTAAIADCQNGGTIRILPMVATAFLRLVTNKKIFPAPTPMVNALAFLDFLLAIPGAEMPLVGSEWVVFRKLGLKGDLKGNEIPDAWIAAAVKLSGDSLVTFDRGFSTLLDKNELVILDA